MTAPPRPEDDRGRRTWWWVAGLALVLVVAVTAVVWLLAGRDDDTVAGVEPTPSAAVESTPTPTPSPAPNAAPTPPAPTTPAPEPVAEPEAPESEAEPEPRTLAGATYGPFSGAPADPGREGSWIADVRSAGHSGYDRVVVEFDGDFVPSYQVGYTPTSGPFYDVPGNVVPVAGTAFLDVWLQGTSRVNMMQDYEPVYTGPDRVRSDTVVVTEVVEIEDFEANVHWIIGLDDRTPFVVWTLDSPSRLVIDIAA